jgi:septal ring-binding cell division protein DamX
MNYEFALDKKAVISVIAGSVVIAVLLFVAGWVIGRQWTVAASGEVASTTANDERNALPTEPVLNEEVSAPKAQAPGSAKPKLTVPKEAVEAPPQASAVASAATNAVATKAMPAAQPVGEVRIIESTADDASGEANANAAEPEYVTVQVGVFLDQKEASQLLQQIERKGYAPTFFSGRDAEARQWYAVRIGVYSDKQQAANAAANFTKQEKIKAVVRPISSL